MDTTLVAADKSTLRRQARATLAALDPGWRSDASRAVCAHLSAAVASGTVLAYAPMGSEVDVEPLLEALGAEHRLVLCRVDGWVLELHRVADLGSLRRGGLGAREPTPDHPVVAPGEIDLVLVPGLAFGRDGTRLGRGGGYFDRLLPQLRARRVGVCFGAQLFDTVPTEPHDARVDAVVTEQGWRRTG